MAAREGRLARSRVVGTPSGQQTRPQTWQAAAGEGAGLAWPTALGTRRWGSTSSSAYDPLASDVPEPQPSIVLLSGGLDSATALALALGETSAAHALSFRYGQRHEHELALARRLAETHRVPHRVISIDLRQFGGSALTSEIEVPKHRELDGSTEIPITYVPARNTVFLSYALAWAEVLGAEDIFIGVNSADYSGYPDCRLPPNWRCAGWSELAAVLRTLQLGEKQHAVSAAISSVTELGVRREAAAPTAQRTHRRNSLCRPRPVSRMLTMWQRTNPRRVVRREAPFHGIGRGG